MGRKYCYSFAEFQSAANSAEKNKDARCKKSSLNIPDELSVIRSNVYFQKSDKKNSR